MNAAQIIGGVPMHSSVRVPGPLLPTDCALATSPSKPGIVMWQLLTFSGGAQTAALQDTDDTPDKAAVAGCFVPSESTDAMML